MTALRAGGSEFPVELTITRTGLPGSPVFIGYFRDITHRQRAAQELIVARASAIPASDAARQRVTRDLHDGAQQRFVSAIIGLQLAQRKWVSEPRRARELVDLALSDATHGMNELRELAAGIHPAILTQRGLAACSRRPYRQAPRPGPARRAPSQAARPDRGERLFLLR